MDEMPVFRAAKRRKFARPHERSSPDPAQQLASFSRDEGGQPANDNTEVDRDGTMIGISNLIRARKNVRRPVTGVQFSTIRTPREADEGVSTALVQSDQTVDKPIDITGRFVGSTGQVVHDDKHMFVAPSRLPPNMDTVG